jgi:diacylglycerol kinase family enzyme
MLFNGKYTGAGMIVDPFACMNDGLLDICWLSNERLMGLLGVADLLDKAKK